MAKGNYLRRILLENFKAEKLVKYCFVLGHFMDGDFIKVTFHREDIS